MTLSLRLKNLTPRKMRKRVVKARHAMRLRSAETRALPDFLVIGTQRGGTSSLYKYLSGHPQIVPSLRKETEYFAGKYSLGENWYRAHFPTTRTLREDSISARQTFEATPDYLLHPLAARRASQLVPLARVVALLRDPIERAYSHHRHMTRRGLESLPFEAAIDVERERCADDWERLSRDEMYRPRNLLRYSYLQRGHYEEQLVRWLEEFGEDRTLVVMSERFFDDTRAVFGEILAFLELDHWRPSEMPNHSAVGDSPAALDGPLRSRLMDYFRPYNERLESLLGQATGWGY